MEKKDATSWANSLVQKLSWVDVQLIKLSVIGFTLLIAKLWEPILSLEWYWYAALFVLAAILPVRKIFSR